MANIFSNIKERILYLSEIKKITKEKFFEDLGVTYGNFKGKAKEKALSSDVLAKIVAKYPDINPNWLLTGEGEMFKNKLIEKNMIQEFFEDDDEDEDEDDEDDEDEWKPTRKKSVTTRGMMRGRMMRGNHLQSSAVRKKLTGERKIKKTPIGVPSAANNWLVKKEDMEESTFNMPTNKYTELLKRILATLETQIKDKEAIIKEKEEKEAMYKEKIMALENELQEYKNLKKGYQQEEEEEDEIIEILPMAAEPAPIPAELLKAKQDEYRRI